MSLPVLLLHLYKKYRYNVLYNIIIAIFVMR